MMALWGGSKIVFTRVDIAGSRRLRSFC